MLAQLAMGQIATLSSTFNGKLLTLEVYRTR